MQRVCVRAAGECRRGQPAPHTACPTGARADSLRGTRQVRGMPDSGFFLDTDQGPKYHSNMQWVSKVPEYNTTGVRGRGNAFQTLQVYCLLWFVPQYVHFTQKSA